MEKKAFGEFKCQIFVIEVRITESRKRSVAGTGIGFAWRTLFESVS